MNSNDILNKERIKKWTVRLLSIAFVILLVQNGALVILVGYFITPSYIIDLIGFLLLAGGYLLYSTQEVEHKRYYFLGGLCILGWTICRVLYQFIIPFLFIPQLVELCPEDYSISTAADYWMIFIRFFAGVKCPFLPLWTTVMTVSIFIGGLALALGSIAIWRTQKEKKGHEMFMVYGVCNALVISLFAVTGFPMMEPFFGGYEKHIFVTQLILIVLYFLKGSIVPFLGVIAFSYKLKDIQSTR
ncbi:MAG: hypothetical protein ACFFDI_13025 [Promethearchaeota archaeon]